MPGGALVPAAAALAGAAGLTVWASLATGSGRELVAGVGIFASAVLAVALVGRWPDVLPWALALLGAQYAASLLLQSGGIDGLAPLYAALLLTTAELSYWALEARPGLGGASVVARRLLGLFLLALTTAVAGVLLLGASDEGTGSSFVLEVVGLGAAAAAIGLVSWLAWRARSS